MNFWYFNLRICGSHRSTASCVLLKNPQSVSQVFPGLVTCCRFLPTSKHSSGTEKRKRPKMETERDEPQFEKALDLLAGLQTNHQLLLSAAKAGGPSVHITRCISYLERLGITQSDLSDLKIIHVSGTKGKGSVCAFAESILRNCGYKTGFFSSPHLIEVVERIKIDGIPLSRALFGEIFLKVYHCLWEKRSDDSDMPAFFHMLLMVAFQVFVHERVDVAIFEVGLGGKALLLNRTFQKNFRC